MSCIWKYFHASLRLRRGGGGGGGGGFEEFSALDNFNRASLISGCENWDRYNFKASLKL